MLTSSSSSSLIRAVNEGWENICKLKWWKSSRRTRRGTTDSLVSWILIESHFSAGGSALKQSRKGSLILFIPVSHRIETQIRWKFNSNFQMQCDAINLVRYRSEKRAASTTTTGEMGEMGAKRKRGKFEKYPKCFHMMANTQKKKSQKKKDGKRKDGTVVVVLQKLPWQKEFQHFVPLSKAGKRSTTWQHFFLFLLPSSPIDSASFFLSLCRNNLHTFSLCLSLCRCCRKQNVLRAKKMFS